MGSFQDESSFGGGGGRGGTAAEGSADADGEAVRHLGRAKSRSVRTFGDRLDLPWKLAQTLQLLLFPYISQ
jgi:hypothetical protein